MKNNYVYMLKIIYIQYKMSIMYKKKLERKNQNLEE